MQDIENASRVEKSQQCGGINFPERNVRHAKETHEEKCARASRVARISQSEPLSQEEVRAGDLSR